MKSRGLHLLLLLGVSLSALACDPGWNYEVSNATRDEDGLIPLPSLPTVGFRIAGSLFGMILSTDLEITNEGDEALSVEMDNATLSDAVGNRIAVDHWVVDAPCEDRDGDGFVRLDAGQRCLFRAVATVNPLAGRGLRQQSNPDLTNLTLVHDGIAQAGQNIRLTVQMAWDAD